LNNKHNKKGTIEMNDIILEGLNPRQQLLADIIWAIEEWDDVEKFIASLPKREKAECKSIVEIIRMEVVDQYRKENEIEDTPEADNAIRTLLNKLKK
jgi:hypothetical protein